MIIIISNDSYASPAGPFQPLMGVEQSASGVPPIPSRFPSAAVIDVTENMRAKIYILCCKMGGWQSLGWCMGV